MPWLGLSFAYGRLVASCNSRDAFVHFFFSVVCDRDTNKKIERKRDTGVCVCKKITLAALVSKVNNYVGKVKHLTKS